MFKIAILIGGYSYLIFFLGILGLFYRELIFIVSFVFVVLVFLFLVKISPYVKVQFSLLKVQNLLKRNKFLCFLLLIIIFQSVVNLIGALGPEHAFDALWYHLTLPKIYLENHRLEYIPGGLFYYSTMPQFTEMLYLVSIALGNEIIAKIIHFSFGILSLIVLYKLSRKFFSQKLSVLCLLIFSSNLVFAWESITAYIDLTRTFFEVLALERFLNFLEKKEKKFLFQSAFVLGFAIATKLLALGSLGIFTLLLIILERTRTLKLSIKDILVYWYISILIVLPWLIFAFVNTQNPVYPFFSNTYKVGFDFNLLNPIRFILDIWEIFTYSADPISPIYIMVFPIIILFFKNINKNIYPVFLYSFLALLVWYMTPRTGGGRFILPYLPAFSIVVVSIIESVKKEVFLKNTIIALIVVISLISLIYRGIANAKYLPVILGKESKQEFLTKNLNFSFGDFYDTDNYFKNNISKDKKVLLYGFHNLYYLGFPFIDNSYLKKEEKFDYVAVQNIDLPKKFKNWYLIYENNLTKVKVYSNP